MESGRYVEVGKLGSQRITAGLNRRFLFLCPGVEGTEPAIARFYGNAAYPCRFSVGRVKLETTAGVLLTKA